MPGRILACFSCIYRNLVGITVKPRYRSLGILGHSLRNKIPIVGNQGESEVIAKQKTEPLLTLHMVATPQEEKCGLKYVM